MAQIICVYVVHASLLKFPMNNNDLEGLAYTNEMVQYRWIEIRPQYFHIEEVQKLKPNLNLRLVKVILADLYVAITLGKEPKFIQ